MSKEELIDLNKNITKIKSTLAVRKSKRDEYLSLLQQHNVSTIKQANALISKLSTNLKSMQKKRGKLTNEIERTLIEVGEKIGY